MDHRKIVNGAPYLQGDFNLHLLHFLLLLNELCLYMYTTIFHTDKQYSSYVNTNFFLKKLFTFVASFTGLNEVFNMCIMQIPLWHQKASQRAEGLTLWDYHVICVQVSGKIKY